MVTGQDYWLLFVWKREGDLMAAISFVISGDSFITQRLPHDTARQALRDYLQQFDVRFTNFEVLVHDFEVYPAPVSGGTWAVARPDVIDDLQYIGFNMMTWANNHIIDWNLGGILTTMRHLDEHHCLHAGVGRNLEEASQPKYLDTPAGRVAIIGVTSTMSPWGMASMPRADVLGRPGANVLRYETTHFIKPEEFQHFQDLIDQTDVNANRKLNEKEGFAKPVEGGCFVGNIRFEPGEPGTKTRMNRTDAERLLRAIAEARRQADVVLVSHHSHERKGMDKELPADFCRDFAHLCLEHGADAYIGHGPHIWRGIEIYQGKPIFYSLGDFIFQNDSVERQPTEFYDLYNLGPEATVSDGLDSRSGHGTRGLAADPRVYQSALPSFSIEDGKISDIVLRPISLGFDFSRGRKGRPYFPDQKEAEQILAHIAKLSRAYGTTIQIEQGVGHISML